MILKMEKPIFILASERSGTNLFRRMLGSHSIIASPPPPHLWKHLGHHLPYYGPLSEDFILDQLINDAIKMTVVDKSHLEWKHRFSLDQVKEILKVRSLTGVVCALYELYTYEEKAEACVFKEIDIYDYIFEIRELYPKAKFIVMVRDGRDVCCSVKKVNSLDHHVYNIALTWKEQQENFLRIHQNLLSRNATYLFRYEDLLNDPQNKLMEICTFIGIEFEEEMLQFFINEDSQSEADKKPDYWRNLSKPLMKHNKRKFLKELSKDEILMFESVAGRVLRLLGYELTSNSVREFSQEEIAKFSRENDRIKAIKQKESLKEPGNLNRAKTLESIRKERREGEVVKNFISEN